SAGNAATVSGFGTNGAGWSLNGGATVAGNVATLTDGGSNEARSLFNSTPVPTTGSFTASFTYTAGGNKAADGFGFVLQTQAATAVGSGGGGKGYDGITGNKAAVLFNIYTGAAGNVVGPAFTTSLNGPADTAFNASAPVNLASGNPINMTIVYN